MSFGGPFHPAGGEGRGWGRGYARTYRAYWLIRPCDLSPIDAMIKLHTQTPKICTAFVAACHDEKYDSLKGDCSFSLTG